MTLANQLRIEGGSFHLTHRGHDRSFPLKFAKDRNASRDRVRDKLKDVDLSHLDSCLTCHHVHLILDSDCQCQVSDFMQALAGEQAKAYHRRKGRENAYWDDIYHATGIDSGPYVWQCRWTHLTLATPECLINPPSSRVLAPLRLGVPFLPRPHHSLKVSTNVPALIATTPSRQGAGSPQSSSVIQVPSPSSRVFAFPSPDCLASRGRKVLKQRDAERKE